MNMRYYTYIHVPMETCCDECGYLDIHLYVLMLGICEKKEGDRCGGGRGGREEERNLP